MPQRTPHPLTDDHLSVEAPDQPSRTISPRSSSRTGNRELAAAPSPFRKALSAPTSQKVIGSWRKAARSRQRASSRLSRCRAPLADGREHHLHGEELGNPCNPSHPPDSGRGEDYTVEALRLQLPDPRVEVPRNGMISRSGIRFRSWIPRRSEPVPIRTREHLLQLPSLREIRTSRGSSLSGITVISRASGSSAGTSFMLCTAMSMSSRRSASSISLMKTPFPPIWARATSCRISPFVRMVTSSTRHPDGAPGSSRDPSRLRQRQALPSFLS